MLASSIISKLPSVIKSNFDNYSIVIARRNSTANLINAREITENASRMCDARVFFRLAFFFSRKMSTAEQQRRRDYEEPMLFLKKQQENDLLPKTRTFRFSVDLIFLLRFSRFTFFFIASFSTVEK